MVILLSGVQFVQVIIRLRVQFVNNLHKWFFQRVSKLHEPEGFSLIFDGRDFFQFQVSLFSLLSLWEKSQSHHYSR